MHFARSSGILLHVTSLPSRWGIGDLGSTAYQFVDFLVGAGQRFWQIMPLGPTGYGDSPYQCLSSFAGNPLLISPEVLLHEGWLTAEDTTDAPFFPDGYVDFGAVIPYKQTLLRRSFARWREVANPTQRAAFDSFQAKNSDWLDDFALFTALKQHHGGATWNTWEPDISTHQPEAVDRWRTQLADEVELQSYIQFQLYTQWGRLKEYANSKNVRVIGDVPIFVAYDSADVWGNQKLFSLDDAGNLTVIAGVPPDYFSPTGQRWGNPLFRWDVLADSGYGWWLKRVGTLLSLVDVIRLDHFRGFAAYWEVPANEETAVNGRWVNGPGAALFNKLKAALGDLPIIAEDLGLITPDVEALRDEFSFPGMKVLHFAFGGDPSERYLPHNYPTPNCVVYTGTHDNDTTVGWFNSRPDWERAAVQRYLGRDGSDIAWDLMRLALASVADVALFPMGDVLRLGSEARMNMPGAASGNWSWRYRIEQLPYGLADGLRELCWIYGRV